MKFTVVFSSDESNDLSFGLVFIPSPCWIVNNKELLNLNPENPHYQLGSVRKLFSSDNYNNSLTDKKCLILVHNVGHGSSKDLDLLKLDLENEGFSVNIVKSL